MSATPLLDLMLGPRCEVCGIRTKNWDHDIRHAAREALLSSGGEPELTPIQKLGVLIPNLNEKLMKANVSPESADQLGGSINSAILDAMKKVNASIEDAMFAPPAQPMILSSGAVSYGNVNQGVKQVYGSNSNYAYITGGGGGWEPQSSIAFGFGGGFGGSGRAESAPAKPDDPKVEPEPGIRQIDLED